MPLTAERFEHRHCGQLVMYRIDFVLVLLYIGSKQVLSPVMLDVPLLVARFLMSLS